MPVMRALAVLALLGLCSATLAAPADARAPAAASPPATLRVTASAEVSRTPDRVYLDIGVTTQAPRPADAVDRNARRVSTVLAALRRALGPGGQLSTTQYSLTPEYHYAGNGAPPRITGYTASNVVRVRLDDLTRVGAAIDAASGAGANLFQNIRFTLRDPAAARAQALRRAALEARADARALAGALDLRILRVLEVTEQTPAVTPHLIYPQASRMAAARAPTEIESGSVSVGASVTLTVEVAPATR